MANKEQLTILKHGTRNLQKRRAGMFCNLGIIGLITVLLSACDVKYAVAPTTASAPTIAVVPTVTLLPTWTPLPAPTSMPSSQLGTIAMDFTALLCNADWMNGTEHLTPCPDSSADRSGGYTTRYKDVPEAYPADTPILLMVPNAGGLFLRYPSFKVNAGDRFRATLLCGTSAPCDIQFALEYYDAQDKYHEFLEWDYRTGDDPVYVDADLSALAGQNVDLVLTVRIFHAFEGTDYDNGLWVAPYIYRPIH
jgi:hypothetical protein